MITHDFIYVGSRITSILTSAFSLIENWIVIIASTNDKHMKANQS